mgnify:CR=1 FL=1
MNLNRTGKVVITIVDQGAGRYVAFSDLPSEKTEEVLTGLAFNFVRQNERRRTIQEMSKEAKIVNPYTGLPILEENDNGAVQS